MKTTCLLILCGLVSARVLAQSPQSPATGPAASPSTPGKSAPSQLLQFPKALTNASGVVYRDIKLQQVYSYGIGISYVNSNKITQGGYIRFDDLSPELQKKLGYVPKDTSKSPAPKSLEQLRREYIDVADLRQGEANAEQAKLANEKADDEARMKAALRRDLKK